MRKLNKILTIFMIYFALCSKYVFADVIAPGESIIREIKDIDAYLIIICVIVAIIIAITAAVILKLINKKNK